MIDKTIQFFKEIAKIPRESGDEEKIADYLCEFAKIRNLEYQKDQWNNVFIKKKTSNQPPIILQAHTDMVCEKLPEKDFNFKTDAIEIIEENGYLRANGTTLGADNGIGVAQILTVLDSDIACNIEAVFTVSEETSMEGASNFDTTQLKGKQLLNLDGFEENTIIIESACFYDIILKSNYQFQRPNTKEKERQEIYHQRAMKKDIELQKERNSLEEQFYRIELTGLPGGHSGFEIDKNRGNSCIELAKILEQISDYQLSNFVGGTKFNVIPSAAFAEFYTNKPFEKIQEICKNIEQKLRLQYSDVKIEIKRKKGTTKVLQLQESKQIVKAILQFPHGVLYKNEKNEVTTSINLGVVDLQKNEIKVGMRSSRKREEKKSLSMLKEYCQNQNLKFHILGSQPGFESDQNGSLIHRLIQTQPVTLFKEPAKLKSMHIAVEVGFFQEKIPDLQIAIISPNIQGAHTVKECVEIASIERANEWIFCFLKSYFEGK